MIKKFSAVIMTLMLALNLCMLPVFVNAEEPEFEITTAYDDGLVMTIGDDPVSLEAGVIPETTLTFESNNDTVATVGEDGIVTAVGAGEAEITITAAATEEYKETIKIIEVTVKKKENLITTDYDDGLVMTIGDDPVSLNAKADSETTLEFESEDETIASVDNEGNVTALREGETVITITAEETDDYSGSTREIRVYTYEWLPLLEIPDDLPEGLRIENAWVCRKSDEEGNAGEIELLGKNPADLTEEELNDIKAGKLEIWYGYRYARKDQNIETDIDELLKQSENGQLSIKYGDDLFALNSKALDDVDVEHESDSEEIVTVEDRDEDKGVIIANSIGEAVITIKAEASKFYREQVREISVEVVKGTQTIRVNKTKFVKNIGNKDFNIGATLKGDSVLKYKSSDSRKASVDDAGNVTIKDVTSGNPVKITISADETDLYEAAEDKIITLTINRPKTPKLTVKAIGERKIQLRWGRISGARSYRIHCPSVSNRRYTSTSELKIRNINLIRGKRYKYRIRSVVRVDGKTHYSAWSAYRSARAR